MQIRRLTKSIVTGCLALASVGGGRATAIPGGAAPPPSARRPVSNERGPRTDLSFSPDGKILAVAGHRVLELLDATTGARKGVLGPCSARITSVVFSPDGKTLAVGGGEPGKAGEIGLWNVATRQVRLLSGLHSDVVQSLAWSPDSKRIAAGSYDRLVSLWDVATGKGRKLRDHTDAVYSVAFSSDGARIASAAGDRTVKIWDADAGRRLFTLGESTAELYSVAFSPDGKEVVAGGEDRMLRKWRIEPTSGTLVRSAFAHDRPVLRVVYSPDGSNLYSSGVDQAVKVWNAESLSEAGVLPTQPDWVLGLAVSHDGRWLATGRYNGTVAVYDVATRRVRWKQTAPEGLMRGKG